jgi:hypothetical protein
LGKNPPFRRSRMQLINIKLVCTCFTHRHSATQADKTDNNLLSHNQIILDI